MAVGMAVVIIAGGIDLSVGAIYALASVVGALVLNRFGPESGADPASSQVIGILLGAGACLGVAALCGLATGSLIVALRVHPFIITLGGMAIYRGFAFVFTKGQSIGSFPAGFRDFVRFEVGDGLSFVPLGTWVAPTLNVDVGRYSEGDANPIARTVSGDASFSSPMLEKVGYDYLNAHVGLELGRDWATFYIHAGMSRVSGQIRGLEEAAEGDVTISEDPHVTMWAPSARVGLIVYVAK
jgi:hypothetical protein